MSDNGIAKTFAWYALLFLAFAAVEIAIDKWPVTTIPTKIDCPDYPPVDGAGRPEVCK